MKFLEGGSVAAKIYTQIRRDIQRTKRFGYTPRLGVVLVGDDPASLTYISVKKRRAEDLGVTFDFFHFPEDVEETHLCHRVVELNRLPQMAGIIIQLPLPERLNRQQVLDCVLPSLDIDGLSSGNQAKLSAGQPLYVPPTPAAILKLLEAYQINLKNKHVVIVGAGDLVGKPLSKILMQRGVTVSVATSATPSLGQLTAAADVLVTGVGKAGLIKASMIKKGAVVVDAGTSFVYDEGEPRLSGDVDFASVAKKAGAITPTPGGVGPLTVAMLFYNFALSCKRLTS